MRKQGNQKHLTFEQRVDIEKGLTENKSFAEIAKLIGKDPSTVSKEVAPLSRKRTSGCRLYKSTLHEQKRLQDDLSMRRTVRNPL